MTTTTRPQAMQSQASPGPNQQQLEAELAEFRALLKREQQVAKAIFNSLLRNKEMAQIQGLRWQLGDQALFHGDLILTAKAPGGSLHLLVGDFPGRGLSASIGSLPVAEVFYTMTDKGFELTDIVSELNRRLRRLLPNDIFFAVCLVAIDASGQQAQVWNGGLPPLLHYQSTQATWKGIESRHLPLGILPNERLNRAMQLVSLDEGDRLLLHTDSLLQRLNRPVGDLLAWLDTQKDQTPTDLFDRLVLASQLSEFEQADARLGPVDATILEYEAGQGFRPQPAATDSRLLGTGIKASWNYELCLDPDGLRGFDPRPMLTQLLVEIQGLHEHREKIYTLIAELYSNALEHGLLSLDSQLKSSPEGFANYYLEREMRLAVLEEGSISFRLTHDPEADGGVLGIEVEDSGPGFDFEKQGLGELKNHGYSGRGIGLVRSLARTIAYFPPGNRVRISYHWHHL